jgi:hypothetical protein
MIPFLIKKTFFDLWDNLFKVLMINLGFTASVAVTAVAPSLVSLPALALILLYAGISWCFVYLAAAARSLRAVSDYGVFDFKDFFRGIRRAWPAGLVMGLLTCFASLLITRVIPFYIGMNSMVGLFLAAVIFWTLLAGVLALQFFLPLYFRLGPTLFKAFKKSMLICVDNPFFCVFSLIHNTVLLVLSALTAFLIPGPAGIILYLDEALRLRLLKYDWIEAHPQAPRGKIPWELILMEEREKTGSRSLRSLIFPWKD